MLPLDPPTTEEDGLDLRAYLYVLRRRWKVIIAVTLAAVSLALAISLQQENQYQVRSELLVRQRDGSSLLSNAPSVQANEAARSLCAPPLLGLQAIFFSSCGQTPRH